MKLFYSSGGICASLLWRGNLGGGVSGRSHRRGNGVKAVGVDVAVYRSGSIIMPPESNIKTGQWKYRIEGTTVERRQVAVVFSFKNERAVVFTMGKAIHECTHCGEQVNPIRRRHQHDESGLSNVSVPER